MQILLEEPRRKTYILPRNLTFTREPPQNAIGLVLSSNWVGFVVKTLANPGYSVSWVTAENKAELRFWTLL